MTRARQSLEIERTWDGNAWLYPEALQNVVIDWLLRGFNLAIFDNWLEEPGWDSERAQAARRLHLERRARALAAALDGNDEAEEAWLNYLALVLQFKSQREVMQPLARRQAEVKKAASKRAATRNKQGAKYTPAMKQEWRLLAAEKKGTNTAKAKAIIRELKLDESALSSVRQAIGKKGAAET